MDLTIYAFKIANEIHGDTFAVWSSRPTATASGTRIAGENSCRIKADYG
jgi:hypothetical protein